MKSKNNLLGVERTLTDIGKLAKWNRKLLRWIVLHNTEKQTKQYYIDLQMQLVSSERIIKVDDQVKHRSLVSFGFNVEFQISESLKGHIKQDGFTFQLYINGQSFTSMAKKQYGYQPLQLPLSEGNSIKNQFRKQKKMIKQKETEKQIQLQQIESKKQQINVKIKQPTNTQIALKKAQEQAMRIMIEQKKKRKLLAATKKTEQKVI